MLSINICHSLKNYENLLFPIFQHSQQAGFISSIHIRFLKYLTQFDTKFTLTLHLSSFCLLENYVEPISALMHFRFRPVGSTGKMYSYSTSFMVFMPVTICLFVISLLMQYFSLAIGTEYNNDDCNYFIIVSFHGPLHECAHFERTFDLPYVNRYWRSTVQFQYQTFILPQGRDAECETWRLPKSNGTALSNDP